MKRSISTFCLLFILLSAFAQEQKLKEIIAGQYISGIQLVHIKNNKTQVFNIGNITKAGKKVTSNTIFEAASLSKCVFAYTVMRLYDRGVISLDTPLLHYYKDHYIRFDTDPRYEKITARMVLSHRTGLPNWGDDKGAKLIFTPDSTFSYSGEGFVFLQRVVEKLTNKPLQELAQQEVFTPLKMTNSNYLWVDKYDSVAAFGNSTDAINRHKNPISAYSLLTNAHDYSLFVQALSTGVGLKPATKQLMFQKASEGNWFNHDITEANPHIGWGLGVGVQDNELGHAIWHWGDNGDFKVFFISYPDRHESLVYFVYNNAGLNITADILDVFLGKQTWWTTKWLGYGFKKPAEMKAFRAQLPKYGYDHAANVVENEKKKNPAYQLPEDDLNDFGFMLMRNEQKTEALEIFKLNLSLYPNSANGYDSLAEAYEALGQKEPAIKNFKRSLELNPKNDYAAGQIKKLEADGGK